MAGQTTGMIDWNNEVTPHQMPGNQTGRYNGMQNQGMGMQNAMQNGMWNGANMPMRQNLDMQNTVNDETIESPLSVSEAYRGSLKAMLLRNRGNYVVATFLIGTQNTVAFEGVLYEVGNDFVTIYQEGRDRYIVVDMYSLKYMEFYDTRRREMCEAILQENGTWRTM